MKLYPKDTAEDTAIKTNIKIYNSILKRNNNKAGHYYLHQFDQYKINIKKTWGIDQEIVNRATINTYIALILHR